jgi:hypothetical protein
MLSLPSGVDGDSRVFSLLVRSSNIPAKEVGVIPLNYKGKVIALADEGKEQDFTQVISLKQLKLFREKFNVGMVNSTDFNVSKIQLSNAESDLASAKYDFIFKTKILDFYLGRKLTLKDIAQVQE